MQVKIYITSNIKGKMFEKRVSDVLNDLGLDAEVITINRSPSSSEKAFYTPALFVNNELVSSGSLLSKEEITHFFM
ncbi:thioredoxin family protein [Salipaludibacillus daqingensis]|uniref:thioredoxin family protein n=1 Tax=Salipaludibacillus daqingensis TaxID=3041001 RepID=UPI0024731604|nr:thioredoxin family protein [Salipaludibacillus daqingensis]